MPDLEEDLDAELLPHDQKYGEGVVADIREAIANWLRNNQDAIAAPHVVGTPADTVSWVAGLIDPFPINPDDNDPQEG